MANIYLPKTSTLWRIQYYDRILGLRKSISTNTNDKAIAKRILKDFQAKLRLGMIQEQIKTTDKSLMLADLCEQYLKNKLRKEKTLSLYRIAIKHLIDSIGDKNAAQLNMNDYNVFLKHLQDRVKVNSFAKTISTKLSVNSIATYTLRIYAIMKWAKDNELIKINYFKKTQLEQKEVRIIAKDELKKIFDELLNTKYYETFRTIYLLALRANEVRELKTKDFDLKALKVQIMNIKGKRIDLLPIISDTIKHIKNIIKRPEPIFGETYDEMKCAWYRVMKKTNLDYSIHDLRRTRGTELAEIGINPYYLKLYMRHDNIKTTEKYYINVNREKMRLEMNEAVRVRHSG